MSFGALSGDSEGSMAKLKLQTRSRAGVRQNGESNECRAESNDPVEPYRRMELKGASSSSAPRGRMRGMEGAEGVLSSD